MSFAETGEVQMLVLKVFLCFICLMLGVPQASAESISEAATRISNARDKKAELEKNQVKIGETIQDVGNLTIEDFLELEAVPDGMDAVSAQALNGAPDSFDFMTTQQALKSIAAMRRQGILLPDDLEEKIKKNPEQASQLMYEAFETIPAAKVENKDDIAQQRKAVIKDAENNLGIKFKDVLELQKQMMNAPASKGRKRGRR
ncbi:MAG: hypothetical protein IJ752_05960 [Alphaproteobacteria bacterium]|nr:hypothetical protein [Alphaproteobacteria bacterium]